MRTSSMLTRRISGGARPLWRAQTNPYDAQNLVRATMTAPRPPIANHTFRPYASLIPADLSDNQPFDARGTDRSPKRT